MNDSSHPTAFAASCLFYCGLVPHFTPRRGVPKNAYNNSLLLN